MSALGKEVAGDCVARARARRSTPISLVLPCILGVKLEARSRDFVSQKIFTQDLTSQTTFVFQLVVQDMHARKATISKSQMVVQASAGRKEMISMRVKRQRINRGVSDEYNDSG